MKRLIPLLLALGLSFNAFATCELKADTAATITAGMFVDATDGVATEEALTLVVAEVFLSKNGGALAAKSEASNPAHLNAGVYDIDLNTTDTNTEGTLDVYIEDNTTAALRVWRHCMVLGAEFYDTKYGTTNLITTQDVGLADFGTVTVTNQTTFVLSAGHANNDAYNDHTICVEDGTNWGCEEIDDYVGGTTTVTLSQALGFTVASTDNYRIFAPGQTFTMDAIVTDTGVTIPSTLGTPAGADMSADTAAVKADTAATLVDTADMQPKLGTPAADLAADVAAVKVDTAATLVDTGTTIPGILGTPTGADLATDIANVAASLGIAEPGAVPGFGADAGDVLSWLLTLSRNEINQTATTKTIRNDADSADIATCAVSDDGTTFTRAECL